MQPQTTPVLVTGGTGTLGRLVVAQLQAAGRPVRVLTRSGDARADGVEFVIGDLATGVGIEAAVAGVPAVVHCAGSTTGDGDKAGNLVRAALPAGVAHLVYISVVGADRIPQHSRIDRAMFGYFGSKLAAERIIADSGIPYTTLRATQFHDLVLMAAQALAKLPVLPAPVGFRVQPVDAGEVAARLVELAADAPAGLVPDLGGPRTYQLSELLRNYLRATRRRRLLLPVPVPGGAARAFRSGANLARDGVFGTRTWEDFLIERMGAQSDQVPRAGIATAPADAE